MAYTYGKKPTVKRFKMDKVRPGRIVRKTEVSKRNPLVRREKKGKTMRQMKKGR